MPAAQCGRHRFGSPHARSRNRHVGRSVRQMIFIALAVHAGSEMCRPESRRAEPPRCRCDARTIGGHMPSTASVVGLPGMRWGRFPGNATRRPKYFQWCFVHLSGAVRAPGCRCPQRPIFFRCLTTMMMSLPRKLGAAMVSRQQTVFMQILFGRMDVHMIVALLPRRPRRIGVSACSGRVGWD
jgi:hypothetical protein